MPRKTEYIRLKLLDFPLCADVCVIALLAILTESFVFSPQVMAHSTPQGILDDVAMVS